MRASNSFLNLYLVVAGASVLAGHYSAAFCLITGLESVVEHFQQE